MIKYRLSLHSEYLRTCKKR